MLTSRTMLLLALALAVPAVLPVAASSQEPSGSPPPAADPQAVAAPLLGTTAPPAPAGATSERLTFADALRRALAANPGLGSARAEVNVAQSQIDLSFSLVLPRVSLSGSGIRNSEEASFGSGDEQRTILPENDWSYRLSVTQPIFAGNRERRALQQARAALAGTREAVAEAEEELLFATAANYQAVLAGDALIEVERQNLELAAKRRRQAQALFEAGETTRVEPLRAEAATKAAERRLAEARQSREAAAGRLRLNLALEGPVEVSPSEGAARPVLSESALAAEAEARRPEVKQAEKDLEIARLEIAKQRGALLPVVASEGGYIRQRSPFPSDAYGFFALRFNVPLYQGGEVGARVAAAKERQRQAELRLSELKQRVREQVHQTLVALSTTETRLALAQDELAASEAEYAQAENLYRAQETTALDFEAAERSLAQARREVASNRLDRDVAELAVWAAAGMLKTTLLPEEPQ